MKTKQTEPSPAEVARVLKALPKTADGKVVYPGMSVCILAGTGLGFTREIVESVGTNYIVVRGWGMSIDIEENRLFSTRAAALAECSRRNAKGAGK